MRELSSYLQSFVSKKVRLIQEKDSNFPSFYLLFLDGLQVSAHSPLASSELHEAIHALRAASDWTHGNMSCSIALPDRLSVR